MIFIRLDANVSHYIADLARKIGVPQGVVLEAPKPLNEEALPDTTWMERLADRGGPRDLRAAFSADNFKPHERALAEELGIILFSVPRSYWRPLLRNGQVALVLRWLPRIIELVKTSPPGSQYRLPPSFNPAVRVRLEPRILEKKVVRSGRPRKARPLPLLDAAVASAAMPEAAKPQPKTKPRQELTPADRKPKVRPTPRVARVRS